MKSKSEIAAGGCRAGLALIFLAGGLSAVTPARAHLSIIHQGAESRGTRETGDRFGEELAAADFNGDGYDDLATAAVGENSFEGVVIVNPGSRYGLTQVGADILTEDDFGGAELVHSFGGALAAGDFNHDGYHDLAVGTPGYDGTSVNNIGRVYLYSGGPGGLTPWATLRQTDAGGAEEEGDLFGDKLLAGDMNGDGYDDLFISAVGEDDNAGVVFWFMGSAAGLGGAAEGWIKQSTIGGTNEVDDSFGLSLALGNLVGDSRLDLVVGAPNKTVGGQLEAGQVTVITGGASGPVTGTVYNYNNASGDLGAAVVPNSHFGYAVAVGRFQPGTYASLAVGEPDRVYFGISQAGRVGVGLGGATGLDWTGDEQHILLESEAGGTISEGDRFGMRLAAGRFEAVGSYDEVVVGVIMDDLGTGTSQLGQICGFYGGAAGPGNNGWFGFNQGTCNSSVGYNHSFGRSLAFGFFDDSGKGALAAGAPGDANGTGAVHIIAPWRQRYNLHCNTAVITDCEGEWIFSLRPFDRVCIASTTKTMTTLIAAERSQLPSGHPLRVPLSTQYQVKPWIRTYVGGSRYEFWPDEKMRFEDLLYACMYPSGNDASYAIADLLTGSDNDWEGEYPLTCTDFVAEMNARAAALGMDDTFFTNPAGLDAGGPYSTAADMALLARAAMENPLVREVVGQTEHTIDMSYWNYQTGQREDAERTVQNGFLMGLQYSLAEMNGIKGGGTPCAQTTGVFAANSPGEGIAVGGTFGTQFDLPGDPFWYEAPDLMTLGLAECNLDVSFVPGPPEWRMSFGGLNSLDGERIGGGGEIIPGGDRMPELEFTLVRSQGTGFTSGEIVFHRSSEVQFTGGELVNFGVAPFQAHGGFVFTNQGDGVARFRVNTSYPGDDPVVITLDPGESAAIPPYSGPTTGLNVSIENQTGDIFAAPMFIAVREMYAYDLPLIGGTTALDISVPRNGSIVSDGWSFDWVGTDPDGGSTFYASAHEGGSTVDVATDEIEVPGVPVSMKPASPNPFQSRTRLAFELGEPGAVALEIYDAQGRRVRRFAQEAVPAGSWLVDWDGSGDGGVPVANGVYFYRLNFEGRPAGEGRVALLR